VLGAGIVAFVVTRPSSTDAPSTTATGASVGSVDLTATGGKPNVVVVLGCTVRRDQVSPYGGLPETTPFLQARADQGVLFTDVIAAAPWTRPSSAALLTGRHPVSFGFVSHDDQPNRMISEDVRTLAQYFDDAGYLTIGATANPNLDPAFGFARGFDSYQEGLDTAWKSDSRLAGKVVADAMLAQVDARRADGEPIYLQAMMLDAHAPRPVTEEEVAAFSTDGMPARMGAYRASLHHFDVALQGYVEALAERGLDESNTVFVMIADHGEGLKVPPHHGLGHGALPMPSVVRVPWIMWGASVARGHQVKGIASGVDLLPTLLGVAGLELDGPTNGHDLSEHVRGEKIKSPRSQAFVDTWFREFSRAAVYTTTYACQRDFGSDVHRDPRFQDGCFHRRRDPDHTKTVRKPTLFADLVAWREAREAEMLSVESTALELDEEMSEHLQMLGYVE
jgi:arylsulfatase A-like enzyme